MNAASTEADLAPLTWRDAQRGIDVIMPVRLSPPSDVRLSASPGMMKGARAAGMFGVQRYWLGEMICFNTCDTWSFEEIVDAITNPEPKPIRIPRYGARLPARLPTVPRENTLVPALSQRRTKAAQYHVMRAILLASIAALRWTLALIARFRVAAGIGVPPQITLAEMPIEPNAPTTLPLAA